MMHSRPLVIACMLATVACLVANNFAATAEPARPTGPWNVTRLLAEETPAEFGRTNGLVREVRYAAEPYRGRPTRVFAYYGRPEGTGPFPAMLLVHGGGGQAFAEWAELWAKRGYVALAMDLAGNGPGGKPQTDGGPPQDDGAKFFAIENAPLEDTWPYQAVAAVLRGHACLMAQGEVDRDRIGITGISWGGYLTCIVAGIDDRLKVAVPVYGCGFLGDNSHWLEAGVFDKLTADARRRWLENFDPSQYLAGIGCPTMFVNGTNDFAYPLDSYQKSYHLVKSPRTLCITVNMPHGHSQGWAPQEIGAFVDSVLKDGPPLARLSPIQTTDTAAAVSFEASVPLSKAELHFTTDIARWQDRQWKTTAAHIDAASGKIAAELPADRPLVCFVTATDQRGLTVSSEHLTLKKE
jgi:dienelactone hydrolase